MNIILFVGEKRSKTAIRMNVRWENGRLAAKQLFDAFEMIGFRGPRIFDNAFERGAITRIRNHKGPIVAMGAKASKRLTRAKIPHLKIIHPAARGKIRNKILYAEHVAAVLKDIL